MGLIELRVADAHLIFTDRHGGVSSGPFASANLSSSVGDDPERVAENRRRVGARLGGAFVDPDRWFRLRQVHGRAVAVADGPGDGGAPEADAAVTVRADRPLCVLTADCAPVALVAGGAVGAVHAGWRGLRDGVVEAAVGALLELARPPVAAVVGPCIHAERYAFGADDLKVLAAQLGPEVRARTADGRPALDLRAGVRTALTRAGVTDVTDVDVCTAASADHFSFRQEGDTGRQALLVVRRP